MVHFGGTVEDIAALPKGGSKILACLRFPSTRRPCQCTPPFEVQRLHVGTGQVVNGDKSLR